MEREIPVKATGGYDPGDRYYGESENRFVTGSAPLDPVRMEALIPFIPFGSGLLEAFGQEIIRCREEVSL